MPNSDVVSRKGAIDYLMAQKGSLENGYVFNREEANAR